MKLTEKYHEFWFNRAVREMGGTPELELGGNAPFTVLSIVQHRDVYPYLLALKSFARFHTPDRVVLVADPSLTDQDKSLLREHVPAIIIRDSVEFIHEGLPTYSSWRRLCAIAEYVADSYVVQLDADTVTMGPLDEVMSAVCAGRCFVLGTSDGQTITSCGEAAGYARREFTGEVRVQGLAEAVLDRLEIPGIANYTRGCAGFSGFAQSCFDLGRLRDISRQMGALLGDAWLGWGTEQFTTNLVISNAPGACVLPHPKYCMPSVRKSITVFLHFIGYERYISNLYSVLAREVAAALRGRPV